MQPIRYGSVSLQALAAVADVLYARWKSTRGAVVIQLYGMNGHDAPLAGWCSEACLFDARGRRGVLGDRRSMVSGV